VVRVKHPAAPTWLKVGTALIALYVLSPIDLIPDTIPLLGWIDDLVIVPSPSASCWTACRPHLRSDLP
jgi:uncharacterized membrane protein YkvA (DUF1232 family)